jgi:hypothetical protein
MPGSLRTRALTRPSPAPKLIQQLPGSISAVAKLGFLTRVYLEKGEGAVLLPAANQAEITRAPQLVSRDTRTDISLPFHTHTHTH